MKYRNKNKLSARSKEFIFLVIKMFTEIYNKIIVFLEREKLFFKWYYLCSIDCISLSAQNSVVTVCLFEMKKTMILLVNLRFCFEYLTRRETYFDIFQWIKLFLQSAFWKSKIILQRSLYFIHVCVQKLNLILYSIRLILQFFRVQL